MTNTRASVIDLLDHPWPAAFGGETLPSPDDGRGPYELVTTHIVDDARVSVELEVELRVDGVTRSVRGSGKSGVAAFVAAVRRAGLEVSIPEREVHDWDGTTASVTSYVFCTVGDTMLWGAGVARDRSEASMRAIVAACNRAIAQSAASTSSS